MHTQYQPTKRDQPTLLAITSSCLHVVHQDLKSMEAGSAEKGSDECCGRNLRRTGCRPLHDHHDEGGFTRVSRRNEKHRREAPSATHHPSFYYTMCHVGCSMHFTCFAYETHTGIKPMTISTH